MGESAPVREGRQQQPEGQCAGDDKDRATGAQHKPASKPVGKDEVREFPKGKLEIANIGSTMVGRATFQPGWRWSESVKPIAPWPNRFTAMDG